MIRQAVVILPLPEPGVPLVLEPPEGFPIWAGCMPSPCALERSATGEAVVVPGIIVMWESRLDFSAQSLAEEWSTNPEPMPLPDIRT